MPPPQSIPGDANLDGNTNVIDVVTIANHLLEIKKLLTGKALTNADQDGDDKLTVVVRERERERSRVVRIIIIISTHGCCLQRADLLLSPVLR